MQSILPGLEDAPTSGHCGYGYGYGDGYGDGDGDGYGYGNPTEL